MKLKNEGYSSCALLFDVLQDEVRREELAVNLDINPQFLLTLFLLVNLTRIRWVSPIVARMLLVAGYDTPQKVAGGDAEEMYNALATVNSEGNYFKGTIGLRDVKRLIVAAGYLW